MAGADMKWMVTGSSGFIGSHFMDLIESGVTVNARHHTEARNVEGVVGDITDSRLMDTLIGRYQPNILVGFAAESSVADSFKRPKSFIDTNIAGPVTILDAIRHHSPDTLYVHVSTDEVYGPAQLAKPDSPLQPNNPYAVSKAAADQMIDVYTRAYNLRTMIVRPTNNWGPRQALPKFMPAMLEAKRTGVPMLLNDPSTERDWLNVEDNVRAIHELALRGETGIWNISTHHHASLMDVIDRAGGVPYTLGPDRPINDETYLVNSYATWERLGWQPTPWAEDDRFEQYVR